MEMLAILIVIVGVVLVIVVFGDEFAEAGSSSKSVTAGTEAAKKNEQSIELKKNAEEEARYADLIEKIEPIMQKNNQAMDTMEKEEFYEEAKYYADVVRYVLTRGKGNEEINKRITKEQILDIFYEYKLKNDSWTGYKFSGIISTQVDDDLFEFIMAYYRYHKLFNQEEIKRMRLVREGKMASIENEGIVNHKRVNRSKISSNSEDGNVGEYYSHKSCGRNALRYDELNDCDSYSHEDDNGCNENICRYTFQDDYGNDGDDMYNFDGEFREF